MITIYEVCMATDKQIIEGAKRKIKCIEIENHAKGDRYQVRFVDSYDDSNFLIEITNDEAEAVAQEHEKPLFSVWNKTLPVKHEPHDHKTCMYCQDQYLEAVALGESKLKTFDVNAFAKWISEDNNLCGDNLDVAKRFAATFAAPKRKPWACTIEQAKDIIVSHQHMNIAREQKLDENECLAKAINEVLNLQPAPEEAELRCPDTLEYCVFENAEPRKQNFNWEVYFNKKLFACKVGFSDKKAALRSVLQWLEALNGITYEELDENRERGTV
jgi:hypothetical protein